MVFVEHKFDCIQISFNVSECIPVNNGGQLYTVYNIQLCEHRIIEISIGYSLYTFFSCSHALKIATFIQRIQYPVNLLKYRNVFLWWNIQDQENLILMPCFTNLRHHAALAPNATQITSSNQTQTQTCKHQCNDI